MIAEPGADARSLEIARIDLEQPGVMLPCFAGILQLVGIDTAEHQVRARFGGSSRQQFLEFTNGIGGIICLA